MNNPPAKTTTALRAALKNLKPPSQRKVFIAPNLSPGAAPAKSMKEEPAAASSNTAPSPDEVAEHPTPTHPQKQGKTRRKSAGARGRPTTSANRRAAAFKPVPEKQSVGEMRQPSARQLRKIKRRLFLEAVQSDNVPGKTRRSSARHAVSGKKALRQGKEE